MHLFVANIFQGGCSVSILVQDMPMFEDEMDTLARNLQLLCSDKGYRLAVIVSVTVSQQQSLDATASYKYTLFVFLKGGGGSLVGHSRSTVYAT